MTKIQLLRALQLIKDDEEIFVAVQHPALDTYELHTLASTRYTLHPGRVELVARLAEHKPASHTS